MTDPIVLFLESAIRSIDTAIIQLRITTKFVEPHDQAMVEDLIKQTVHLQNKITAVCVELTAESKR